jgi:hypothetical protein
LLLHRLLRKLVKSIPGGAEIHAPASKTVRGIHDWSAYYSTGYGLAVSHGRSVSSWKLKRGLKAASHSLQSETFVRKIASFVNDGYQHAPLECKKSID